MTETYHLTQKYTTQLPSKSTPQSYTNYETDQLYNKIVTEQARKTNSKQNPTCMIYIINRNRTNKSSRIKEL